MSTPRAGDPRLWSTPALLVVAVVAFVVEVAIFGGLGWLGHRAVGGGVAGWATGLTLTVVALVLWGLFMAPRARRRLGSGLRVIVSGVLVAGTAYALVREGTTAWGWFVGVAGAAVVAAQVTLPEPAPRG
ncbi:MAG: YrdB family protein [Phycicoccus sp.]